MKPGKRPTGCEKRKISGAHPLCRDVTPTPWAPLSVAPFPPRWWSPPPGQWTQPEPPPLSEAWSGCSQWAPAPSLGPQEVPVPPTGCRGRGAGGREREEERDSLAGGAPSSRGGRGPRKEREAPRRAGGRRGRGRLCGGSGGDKFSGPAAAPPLTWVPAQAPRRCLRCSVGLPGRLRASGPRGSGLGPGPARGAGASPHPRGSRRAGEGPSRERGSERGGERAGRRGGRSAPRASERAELAEGASEGRQAVRSSFESNCLSQEEMWHLMPGEGRGKGPSRLWAGAPPHVQGRLGPPFPRPARSCLRPTRTNPRLSHSGLTSAAGEGGGVSPTSPPESGHLPILWRRWGPPPGPGGLLRLRVVGSPLPTPGSYPCPLRRKGKLQPAFQVTFVHLRSVESSTLFLKLLPALGI